MTRADVVGVVVVLVCVGAAVALVASTPRVVPCDGICVERTTGPTARRAP